jgi:uncharacterized protein YwgA
MSKKVSTWDRITLIGVLCREAPKGSLNRTAVMKCAYFLQTLRAVPLGYDFTLYSYGPYDKDVLDDLDYAEVLGVVESERVEYPGGYGYRIQATSRLESAKECSSEFLSAHEESIQWVLSQFGGMGSADLELAGTVIFVDRESPSRSQTLQDLARRVREVKPHFTEDQVLARARCLQEMTLLRSVQPPA